MAPEGELPPGHHIQFFGDLGNFDEAAFFETEPLLLAEDVNDAGIEGITWTGTV